MDIAVYTRIRLLIPAIILIIASFASSVEASGRRDILWEIVSNCLNTSVADYCSSCRWPRSDSSCTQKATCKETTEVWAETELYVILRDAKMCGCTDEFVHGLALPRARVTGVEDPSRPDGIWKFAWDSAAGRIGDASTLALVVNPPGRRSQDQLHVHLVRLNDDALLQISKRATTDISSLDQVWKAAADSAKTQKLDDYGVLVFQRRNGGFTVLVDRENPEKKIHPLSLPLIFNRLSARF